MSITSIRILPGLPSYGPPALPFPADGRGAHREGLVVEFSADNGERWVGNFQPGFHRHDAVFDTLGTDRSVIVAGGAGYVVDAEARQIVEEFGGGIGWSLELRDEARLVFADGITFESRDRHGLQWRSGRVSWDGMDGLTYRDGKVFGYAWSAIEDKQKIFELDVSTGEFTGGAYDAPSVGLEWRRV